jgi:hypothetical protein
MVLLICSGTGGGIYAKLANGVALDNCARASLNAGCVKYFFSTLLHALRPDGHVFMAMEFLDGTTLINQPRVVDHEGHDARVATLRGIRKHRESPSHLAVS